MHPSRDGLDVYWSVNLQDNISMMMMMMFVMMMMMKMMTMMISLLNQMKKKGPTVFQARSHTSTERPTPVIWV